MLENVFLLQKNVEKTAKSPVFNPSDNNAATEIVLNEPVPLVININVPANMEAAAPAMPQY